MNKRLITPKDGPAPVGPYSPGVVTGGFLFTSGQIPLDPASGRLVLDTFEAQARRTLENLKAVVEAAGATLSDVVKVNIYLVDLGRFEELNAIYAEYFNEAKPARATVQVAGLPKGVAIEIDCIAQLSE